jgi:K+-transporting ATPase ATPase C chain
MFTILKSQLRPALICFVLLTLLTGALYPAAVTVVAQTVFTRQANGSVITENGRTLGSELIGQPFSDNKYFWGRISTTSPKPYDASASSGSNLGPTNPALLNAVNARIKQIRDADPDAQPPIPVDLVTASGSGLDPHISPAAAAYQVRRVARARNITEDSLRKLVAAHTESRTLGVLGEPRVNVLALNLALDAAKP